MSKKKQIKKLKKKLQQRNVVAPERQPGERDASIARSLQDSDAIRKSDSVDPALRERAAKAHTDLSLAHLARQNPGAAEDWKRLHGVA